MTPPVVSGFVLACPEIGAAVSIVCLKPDPGSTCEPPHYHHSQLLQLTPNLFTVNARLPAAI